MFFNIIPIHNFYILDIEVDIWTVSTYYQFLVANEMAAKFMNIIIIEQNSTNIRLKGSLQEINQVIQKIRFENVSSSSSATSSRRNLQNSSHNTSYFNIT